MFVEDYNGAPSQSSTEMWHWWLKPLKKQGMPVQPEYLGQHNAKPAFVFLPEVSMTIVCSVILKTNCTFRAMVYGPNLPGEELRCAVEMRTSSFVERNMEPLCFIHLLHPLEELRQSIVFIITSGTYHFRNPSWIPRKKNSETSSDSREFSTAPFSRSSKEKIVNKQNREFDIRLLNLTERACEAWFESASIRFPLTDKAVRCFSRSSPIRYAAAHVPRRHYSP